MMNRMIYLGIELSDNGTQLSNVIDHDFIVKTLRKDTEVPPAFLEDFKFASVSTPTLIKVLQHNMAMHRDEL